MLKATIDMAAMTMTPTITAETGDGTLISGVAARRRSVATRLSSIHEHLPFWSRADLEHDRDGCPRRRREAPR